MAIIRSKSRVLFVSALIIATTFACDNQSDGASDNNKVECPLGHNCDGGAGSGGVFSEREGGTDDKATGGATALTDREELWRDAAAIASDARSEGAPATIASDSSIEDSGDATVDVGLVESEAKDASSTDDAQSIGTDGTVDTGETTGSGEPCENGRVDGTEAKTLAAQGALLLDVRTPSEFAVDAIPNAINIPLDELASRLDELPTDGVIITYCRSGSRSSQAAQLLRDEGFIVCNLGPRSAWDS